MLNMLEHPRPEYPRPERQRGTVDGMDWLNLNGPWEFRFDGERQGVEEQWFAADGLEDGRPQGGSPQADRWTEQIIVPFCWESLAAWGEGDSAGNENYYSSRVFRNPLEVNPSNHRSAPRYEIGWYRRTVEIPGDGAWDGKRVILTVGAADFFTDCWCNGVHLGRHEGGYTPFEYDLTDALRQTADGKRMARLVLRVEDPMDNREQPVGKQWSWYTTTSGIWQTVFIEPRAESFIDYFRIVSDIDTGTATFQIECVAANDNDTLALEITAPDGSVLNHTLAVQNGLAEKRVEVQPLYLWDPNHPHLYPTILRLQRDGQTLDTVRTYFGMRKIDSGPTCDADAPAALRLNGEARYLRGALYQSYHPDGVYTAGDSQVLRNDILYAKQAGFNFLRVHIKIDDPLLLYYADTLGILLMADFPNFGESGDTPLARSRFETMMRAGMRRDFNHPSIIAWCLFNETWGFGGQVELVKLFPTLEAKPGTAEMDALRSAVSDVLDAATEADTAATDATASVATASDATGLDAVATDALPTDEAAPAAVETMPSTDAAPVPAELDGVAAGQAPVTAATESIIERRKLENLSAHVWVQSIWRLAKSLDPTRLIEDMSVVHWEHLDYYAHGDTDINSWHFYIDDYARAKEHIEQVAASTYAGSTFNYVPGWTQGTQPLINSEYGGVGALDGNRDTSWSFKFLTNELRRQSKISAYIYTELTDVEWEYNGFLNYDRTPKEFGYDPTIINAPNVLPIDAPPIARCAPGETVRIDVASSHYSTKPAQNVSLHWRLSGIDALGVVHQDIVRGLVPIPFKHRCVQHAHTVEFVAPNATILCTLWVEAIAQDGTSLARNFVHLHVSPGYPYNRDEHPQRLILRGAPGEWSLAEWSGRMSNRDEAYAHDSCFGHGHGFYEWALPLHGANLWDAKRLHVLCEASARRAGSPQTDYKVHSSTLLMLLNSVRVYEATLPDHPHDARGALSFLRGGVGAYGYLARAIVEGEELRQIKEHTYDDYLRLRCLVPHDAFPKGGLTIYGAECGRYPINPTVIVEW